MKILLVDDSKFSRFYIKKQLEKYFDNVVFEEAENGIVGIEKYKTFKPDITLMDINMPLMDGVEAVKFIYNFDKNCRIIMCSAIGQSVYIDEALENGAIDFIVKPFLIDKVIYKIINLIK